MRWLKKIIGQVFPPYRFKIQRLDWTLLLNTLIDDLPNDYTEWKEHQRQTRISDLSDWKLFPGYKFISIAYSDEKLYRKFKKRGRNYRISGQEIFSKKLNDYTKVEFLIRENLLVAIKIANSGYEIEEFDLKRIRSDKVEFTNVLFPPTDVDLFYNKLDDKIRRMLNPENIFDVEFNNKIFYAFHDLDDGNYLAVDKNLNVYSLVHDAEPIVKKLKFSLPEVLDAIKSNGFDNTKHLKERHDLK